MSYADREDFPTWGNSHGADFEADTWTFKMVGDKYEVSKGPYALIHNDDFDAMMHELNDVTTRLRRAEELLRPLADSFNALTDNERERIAKFFDPKPL